ncbi:hypothetical protein C8F01DRAFT_1258284 [Mycena amicta]|nr:hypothetical protein C8F01DRAFT_1258284 [Mycena amicta]
MSTPMESSQRAELLSSSALFLLALLPHHLGRFGILVWASVSILRDIALRFSPTGTIKVLLALIATTSEVHMRAQTTCLHHQIPLMDDRRRLAEAQKHASKLRCELLMLSRQSWGGYFARTYRLWKSISKCTEEVEDIHNSIQFVLEAENQRKLDDEIQAMQRSRSIENGITHIRPDIMPMAKSKAELRRMRTTNLQQNISQAVKRTYDTIRDSPIIIVSHIPGRSDLCSP